MIVLHGRSWRRDHFVGTRNLGCELNAGLISDKDYRTIFSAIPPSGFQPITLIGTLKSTVPSTSIALCKCTPWVVHAGFSTKEDPFEH